MSLDYWRNAGDTIYLSQYDDNTFNFSIMEDADGGDCQVAQVSMLDLDNLRNSINFLLKDAVRYEAI